MLKKVKSYNFLSVSYLILFQLFNNFLSIFQQLLFQFWWKVEPKFDASVKQNGEKWYSNLRASTPFWLLFYAVKTLSGLKLVTDFRQIFFQVFVNFCFNFSPQLNQNLTHTWNKIQRKVGIKFDSKSGTQQRRADPTGISRALLPLGARHEPWFWYPGFLRNFNLMLQFLKRNRRLFAFGFPSLT